MLLLLVPPGKAAEFRFRLHHPLPPAAPAHWSMLEPWSARIEAESGNRISISVHASMQLGGQAPQLLNQVRDGVVDIIWTLTGYTPGRFPSLEVFELPALMAHPAVMNRAIADFIERHPDEFSDYKVIAGFVHAGQALHSRVAVRMSADLPGLKIRIPSRVSGWVVESMGATPIGTPVSKVPELLSKGVIDAALIPFEVVGSLQVDELVDYHIVLDLPGSDRIHTQVFMIAMNWDAYRSLPHDLRDVIDHNSGHGIAQWLATTWVNNERPGIELAVESGELIRLPRNDALALRRKLDTEVTARWVASMQEQGLDGRAVLTEARALIEQYTVRGAAGGEAE
ncbi:MAG: TRAP transporter substrate-binding protein [Gammaproteobacteria bacterium]